MGGFARFHITLAGILRLGLAALLFTTGLFTPGTGRAQPAGALMPLAVNGFAGAALLPIWVAQSQDWFRAQGIELMLSAPAGSVAQFQGLRDGDFPLVLTAFDNVVAYHDGQGAPGIGQMADLFAFMAVDRGALWLMASPGIHGVADLKGQVMAIDAPQTGFSFVLRAMLSRAGIAPDQVRYLAVGSSEARLKALRDGRATGGLLNPPSDLLAKQAGLVALTDLASTLPHYLSGVAATRRGWADSHPHLLAGFIFAYHQGTVWLREPAHRAASLALLHEKMPDLAPDLLAALYAGLMDQRAGLFPTQRIDPRDAQAVIDLRGQFTPSGGPARLVDDYIDDELVPAGE